MKKEKLFIIVMVFTCLASAFSSNISGSALLDNSSNHSNIKVRFLPISPSAVLDSAFTDTEGFFSLVLENGIYKIVYSKEGYQSIELDEVFINSDLILEEVILTSKITKEIFGSIQGTLFSDTTYIVIANININSGATLTIEPGTEIKFDGYYSLNISGTLIAQGNKQKPIIFTSNENNPSPGDWAGISFSGATGSLLSNATIEYGGGIQYSDIALLQISNSNLLVDSCLIQYSNEAGIKIIGGEPEIKNTQLVGIEGWALRINGGSGKFYNNKIHNCGPSSALVLRNGAVAEGNWIYNNSGVGILFPGTTSDTSFIQKNLIFNNGTGIMSQGGGIASIKYNTIYNNLTEGITINEGGVVEISGNIINENNTGIGIEEQSSANINISFNLVNNINNFINPPTGVGEITTTNQNGTPSDTYYNIFDNPEFLSSNPYDSIFLHLTEFSPAIDAGNPQDLDPDSTIRDIGAIPFESILSIEFPVFKKKTITAYPNPFKNEIFFEVDKFNHQNVELYIFDLSGKCVITIPINSGFSKKIYWDTMDENGNPVPSGEYIYRVNNHSGIIIKE